MEKIKSPSELSHLRDRLKTDDGRFTDPSDPESRIRVRIAMATCGIASGAREVRDTFVEEFAKRNIDAIVSQAGCMGYCYAEPTVEITKPGCEPVTFGFVDARKASRIIDKYILNHELVDGMIPVNYNTIDNY